MRERAEELGGRLKVAPGAQGGTRVLATLPLAQILS
jgi:signal transduction histidine kinase